MASAARRGGLQRILDVVGAACAALLAFTAVPAVLVVIVGNPLAGGLGHAWRPLPRAALCLLVLAAWVAWAACCAQLLRVVVAHVRSGEVGMRQGSSVLDRMAARIAFGVLALTTFGTPLSLAAGAGASTPAARAPVPPSPRRVRLGAVALPATVSAADLSVQPGDTLWRIADDLLGDGADWTSLAALNLGRDIGGGERFVDPDQLREGWRLRLPSGRTAPPATTRAARPAPPAIGVTSGARRPPARTARARPGLRGLCRVGPARRATAPAGPAVQWRSRPGNRCLSEGAQDAATLLSASRCPGAPSFEAANCLLGPLPAGSQPPARRSERSASRPPASRSVSRRRSRTSLPRVSTVEDGSAWHVRHGALEGNDPSFPYLPVVLPIGDDAEGTWLVPLEPGDVLPVLGEAAPALWRAARAAVGSWAWSDTILVTEDPDDAGAQRRDRRRSVLARRVLFCGDPVSLPPEVAARCAVVTMQPVAASDLTVLVDRQAATLHPMGLVVRPHLQSAETAEQIAELVVPPPDERPASRPRPIRHLRRAAGPGGGPTAPWSPGAVDVRLLTMTPRIDGLQETSRPIAPAERSSSSRTWRCTSPTSSRATDCARACSGPPTPTPRRRRCSTPPTRPAVPWVSTNRAIPSFPPGRVTGCTSSRPTSRSTCSGPWRWPRKERRSPTRPRPLPASAPRSSLIEGEPLANALSGYSWWEAEGHGGRIAAVLVDAACRMASLASDAGLFDLARWGLEQARAVEPYSEALSRAAMQVAAAEGDADRLRLEWRDCQRRVDALDPGGSPSARTESLYGELARRVLVGAARPTTARPRRTGRPATGSRPLLRSAGRRPRAGPPGFP